MWILSTTIVGVSVRKKNMVEDNMYTCFNQSSSNTVRQGLHQGKVEKG